MLGNGLVVAPVLTLPRSIVTQIVAILGRRRSGKSSAAVRLAEQMFKAGVPFVAIDPKGDWWGVRADGDGGPALPIPIFGGSHGDIALTADAGRLIAELVFSHNLTCILDVSDLEEGEPRYRFLADFGDRLYQLHKNSPRPRFVFLEEAHEVIPQQLPPHAARCRRVWIRAIKLGGTAGIGIGIISQRSASVDKEGLSQVEVLIAMRITLDRDRAAIRGWIEHHPQARSILDALSGLADGEAFVVSFQWLPDCGMPPIQQVTFYRRETYDSGRTPTLEDDAAQPATLASINLGQLADQMAAATDVAELSDPEALHRQIATLRERIRVLTADLETARTKTATVEVRLPVFADGDLAALDQVSARIAAAAETAHATSANLAIAFGHQDQRTTLPAHVAAAQPATLPAPPADTPPLGRAQRRVLTVLAQFPGGRHRRQVAMLARYSPNSGGYRNTLSSLRTLNLITDGAGGMLYATPWGVDALEGKWEPLPAGPALADWWIGFVGRDAQPGRILATLLDAWPDPMSRDEVAAKTGYSVGSGGFRNALSKLRTLELITGADPLTADDMLAREARGMQP